MTLPATPVEPSTEPQSSPLYCSVSESIFGSTLSILHLWFKPWVAARLLSPHGVPLRPHHAEEVREHQYLSNSTDRESEIHDEVTVFKISITYCINLGYDFKMPRQ